MVIKVNERFRAIFLKFIKDSENSYSSYNYSGYGGSYNYGGYSGYSNSCYRNGTLYIYFYEWSDMSRGNKVFRSAEDFYEFLAESKIVCTEEQKKIIENNPGFIIADWCGSEECESSLRDINGLKSRCILEDEKPDHNCVVCGKKSKYRVVWGIQY